MVAPFLLLLLSADPSGPPELDVDEPEVVDGGVEADFEPGEGASTGDGGVHYTLDLSDAELKRRWVEAPQTLGSVAFGLVEEGRLLNSVRFPDGDGWVVVSEQAYATQETIDQLTS